MQRRFFSNSGKRYAPHGPQPNPFDAKLIPLSKHTQFKAYDLHHDLRTSRLPFSIRVLVESAMRSCDEYDVTSRSVETILDWHKNCQQGVEVPFRPARVVLQDFTGVPCVVDLAAMRDTMHRLGGDPNQINPLIPVELVIDHSVQVDSAGVESSRATNEALEMHRNNERFAFLKWGQKAFEKLTIVPPGSGIVHQINCEYLARVAFRDEHGILYPDSVVGTDSHTTMVNGIGVLGWGVGGIEAEAAMLGQSLSLVLPEVVGYQLSGSLRDGVTATDLVLTITRNLRKLGVVGKFVEFFGEGVSTLSAADRMTIANMAPEYGATCGYFPVDDQTLAYLQLTGRSAERVAEVRDYHVTTGMFRTGNENIDYTRVLTLDLSTVEPCVAGPKRPHDHIPLKDVKRDFSACLSSPPGFKGFGIPEGKLNAAAHLPPTQNRTEEEVMTHGAVVIAAITSCTNTSNPSVLIAAGLLAKRAVERGLRVPSYVKCSLSPGSHAVSKYLEASGLLTYLEKLGFYIVGYGCMTCIGNSGDISDEISKAISDHSLVAAAVLSGNRNFEARIHPQTAANYLASPPLVVAYALAGNVHKDFDSEPLGLDAKGNRVYLKEIWPTNVEINSFIREHVTAKTFQSVYADIDAFSNEQWQALTVPEGSQYQWDTKSTYIHEPPYFQGMTRKPEPSLTIRETRCLLFLGDSVTTDHISPAGNIAKDSPAARFLTERGVERTDFNTYGSRRGNDEIMVRGTFANTRLMNKLRPDGAVGPKTIHFPSNAINSVYDVAKLYQKDSTPLMILAGKEYGSGSSRDWAAKGTFLLGVRFVLAESFERIHRSNLIGMGVVPLQFLSNQSASSLGLKGNEVFTLDLSDPQLRPQQNVQLKYKKQDGTESSLEVLLRIDTLVELQYLYHGGILQYVLRQKAVL